MPFTHHSSTLVLLPTNQLVLALTIGTSQDISRGLLDVEGELAHDSIPCPTPSVALNPNSINSFNSCQSKCKNSMLGDDSMSVASASLQAKHQHGTNNSVLYSLGIKIDQMTEKLTSAPDANPKACVCDHSPQCRAKTAQCLQKLKKDLSNKQKMQQWTYLKPIWQQQTCSQCWRRRMRVYDGHGSQTSCYRWVILLYPLANLQWSCSKQYVDNGQCFHFNMHSTCNCICIVVCTICTRHFI